LILSSRDGYCTLVMFDDILPAYHTQQHTLQLQSIAQHHSVPLTYSTSGHHSSGSMSHVTPAATPASTSVSLPFVRGNTPSAGAAQSNPRKREPPLTPAASVDESENISAELAGHSFSENQPSDPPKKRRRVALTRVGDLEV
jgi:chromatin assembly factor 1 subunit B